MLPNAALSSTPIPGPFLVPRTNVRVSPAAGRFDTHFGGIALGDPSQGISYQLWTARADGVNVYLSAPNTPEFTLLPGVNAQWVALAFDQNAREFVAYADIAGNASYYWYDSTILAFRTSTVSGFVPRVFASLDDSRPAESDTADVIFAYERFPNFYFRAQRDRYGTEYSLGTAPGTLAQIGMSHVNRFQFAFQNVQGKNTLPPAEFTNGNPL